MKRDQLQQLLLGYYEQMVFCFETLSPEEKADLEQFERKGPTSDWPGWDKHISRTQRRIA